MIALTTLIAPAAARPASNLMFGFTENLPMVVGVQAASAERNVGASGTVFTLVWTPGKTSLTTDESEQLARGVAAVSGMRVILVVRTNGASAPIDATARDQFCTYTRNAVASFPQINDVVVGNEPNANFFWRPQYNPDGTDASPAAYEALLAQCYDLLHAYRATINVAAPATGPDGNDNPNAVSNISHSPTTFILGLGAAYRASGRSARIFDTVVHHPYALSNDERPYLMHPTPKAMGEGDWNRLVSSYQTAFAGTPQAVPGNCFANQPCVPIWYLETGFQTTVPVGDNTYFGVENVRVVPDISAGEPSSPSPPPTSRAPDQATQLRYAVRLAYCQPYVEAIFNFLVRDDPNLVGYQSGVFRVSWQAKGSYNALRQVVAEAAAHQVSCVPPTAPPAPSATVPSATEVDLSWTGSSSSIGVSGYAIYRDGVPIGQTSELSYRDRTAAGGSTYGYSVQAYDAAGGLSTVSPATSVITPAAPPPPPPPPPSPPPPPPPPPPPTPPPPPPPPPPVLPAPIHVTAVSCRVPDVRGRRLSVAASLLKKANCRLGQVRQARGVKHPVVVAQSPKPGVRLRAKGRVDLRLDRQKTTRRGRP